MRPDQMPRQPFPADELDALPESVKEALDEIAHNVGTEDEARIVRAALLRYRAMVSDRSREMLRLVHESGELKTRAEKAEARVQELERENGELRKSALQIERECREAWRQAAYQGSRAKKAEAELAATKKRIAEARSIEIGDVGENGAFKSVWFYFDEGEKCYTLLPLDDEAKS